MSCSGTPDICIAVQGERGTRGGGGDVQRVVGVYVVGVCVCRSQASVKVEYVV